MGSLSHSIQQTSAIHGPATDSVSTKMSAALSPARMIGTSQGAPTRAPGVISNAWPGGYFEATRGVVRTCGCWNDDATGGGGAVQCPCAKIRDCRM